MSLVTTARSTATSIRLRLIETDIELALLAVNWNRLAQGVPFRRWEWLEAWWRHYRLPHDRLHILAAYDAHGCLIGLAPWYLSRHWAKGRVLSFLGTGEVCSDHLTILCVPGLEQPVAQCMADWLSRDAAGSWDLIELDGVDGGDTVIGLLATALAEQDHPVLRQPLPAAWRVPLPADWDVYLEMLSKNRRKKVRRAKREMPKHRCRVRRVELPHELHHGFDILCKLHQQRRNSLGEPGLFTSARYVEFHREVSRRFFDLGLLQLEWLEVSGRPASVTYDLLGDDVVYSYQCGLAPPIKSFDVGTLHAALSLRRAIDDGFCHYDFLRGDEPYKTSWQAVPQPLERVQIAGRQVSARLRFAACQAARTPRGWLASGHNALTTDPATADRAQIG